MDSQKLKIKDIIIITLLTLINVMLFMTISIFYVTPLTILMMPIILSLIEGIVFFTIAIKVPKRGALFIYCVVRGIMGGYLPYIICYIIAGIIVELLVSKMGYGKFKGLSIGYVVTEVFAAIGGTFYPYIIAYDSFFKNAEELVGEGNHKNILDAANMIQSWGALVLMIGIIIAAFIGSLLAQKVLKKHMLKVQ